VLKAAAKLSLPWSLMKPAIFAALVLASLSFACGGSIADDADEADVSTAASAYDPFTATDAAKKAAQQYATNVQALTLTGTLSKDQKSFTWVWTYAGDAGMQVDVQVSATAATVIAHEKRFMFMGQATFNPNTVNVQPSDLQHILTSHHDGIASTMQLGAGLTATRTPRWIATCPKKTIWVDALTGNLM
jgi:hypothetical protein